MRFRWLTAAAVAVMGIVGAAVVTGASGQGSSDPGSITAVMTGAKEVGPGGNKNAGDPQGRGSFAAVIDGRQFCWAIVVKNLGSKPVAAHIHQGGASAQGAVVIPLTQPKKGDPGTSSGCTRASASLLRSIGRNPGGFYVNVHTTDFPSGAVRGQLVGKRK
jgi:CHRD domain